MIPRPLVCSSSSTNQQFILSCYICVGCQSNLRITNQIYFIAKLDTIANFLAVVLVHLRTEYPNPNPNNNPKGRLDKIRKSRMGFLWTLHGPLSPRPHGDVTPMRPHKVSYKVSYIGLFTFCYSNCSDIPCRAVKHGSFSRIRQLARRDPPSNTRLLELTRVCLGI